MGSILKLGKPTPAKGGVSFLFRISNTSDAKSRIQEFYKDIKALNLDKVPGYHAMYIGGSDTILNKSPLITVTLEIGTNVDDKRVNDNFVNILRPVLRKYNGYPTGRSA
jgi:hypothetical protein